MRWRAWGQRVFWFCCLGLGLVPLLWRLAGERFWLLILFQYAPGWLFLAAWLLLLLFGLGLRPRRGWLGLLPAIFWLPYELLPYRFSSIAPGSGLRVLTYNIQAGLHGPQPLGAWLAEQKLDVICLQEARKPMAQAGPDPVPILQAALPGYSLARGGQRGELAVLARGPIRSQSERRLSDWSTCLEVQTEGLRVLNVHVLTGDPQNRLKGRGWALPERILLSAQTRRVQAEALAELVRGVPGPTVLTGDFNSPPTSLAYRELAQVLADSYAVSGQGWGLTFPASRPMWRIDYVWFRGLGPVSSQVLDPGLSDHRALLAEFQRP